MSERWSEKKIWDWYNSRPWIRGCNYMSADCANRIDQWQSYGFDERLATTDEELALAEKTGFNAIRIIIEYFVWKEEHDTFFERFDRYLDVCKKHGISCMVVLANDCVPPNGWQWELGEQKFDIGYHGGKKVSQHGTFSNIPPHYFDDEKTREDYFKMVREVVSRYKDDDRIIIWDVYNEPGNSHRAELTVPHLKRMFEEVRTINPSQPLTSGIWRFNGENDIEDLNEVERLALENSDIISYHSYLPYVSQVRIIKKLKEFGRPLVNTEWLARCFGNNVQDAFPLFYLENVACFNWGFVVGKSQTHELWNSVWDMYEKNPENQRDTDFTKWFHDLYRPSHRPYDPKEIELIREFTKMADEDFEKRQGK